MSRAFSDRNESVGIPKRRESDSYVDAPYGNDFFVGTG
jgi:hypothetical protein